jgi:hypothetical protein
MEGSREKKRSEKDIERRDRLLERPIVAQGSSREVLRCDALFLDVGAATAHSETKDLKGGTRDEEWRHKAVLEA